MKPIIREKVFPRLQNTTPTKFRNSNNRILLSALFYEKALDAYSPFVIYTLKKKDHKGLISIYRVYMELGDPTEYEVANKYFEGWDHWLELQECSWFKPLLREWRSELRIKLKKEALERIRLEAADPDSKSALAAAKFLLEKGWDAETGDIGSISTARNKKEKEKIQEYAFSPKDIEDTLTSLKDKHRPDVPSEKKHLIN